MRMRNLWNTDLETLNVTLVDLDFFAKHVIIIRVAVFLEALVQDSLNHHQQQSLLHQLKETYP